MSTPRGHSLLQALHSRHRSRISCRRSSPRAACGSGSDSALTRAFARPRVASSSRRVAMYDGHMVPASVLRQAPMFMQRSAAPRIPPSTSKRRRVASGRAIGRAGVAQVVGHRRRVDHLARVQPPVRVEQALDLAHRAVELRAEQPGVELAARQPVAVLAGVHAAELEDQLEDLLGDRPHRVDLARLAQVDERPDVQAAHRAVTVEPRLHPVPIEDLLEAHDVLLEPVGRDRRVLHERQRPTRPAAGRHQQTKPGLAHLQDGRLVGGPTSRAACGSRGRGAPTVRSDARRRRATSAGDSPKKVTNSSASGAPSRIRDRTGELVLGARPARDRPVHQLDRRGVHRQRVSRRGDRLAGGAEVPDGHRPARRGARPGRPRPE